MLAKFSISNYRSFYNEAVINLKIEKTDDEDFLNSPYIQKINDSYISKICFLYGYNGCGKSNLINALKYIFYSNNGYASSSEDSIKKLLDPNMIYGSKEKSRFYIEFYSFDEYVLYSYEIILDNEEKTIYSETFKRENIIIFERMKNRVSEGVFHYDDIIQNNITLLSFFNELINNNIDNKINKYREEINYYISLFKNLCFLSSFTNEADFSSYAIIDAFEYFNKHSIWNIYKKLLNAAGIDDLSICDLNIENFSETDNFYMIFDNKKLISKHGTYSNDFDMIESEGSKIYAINLIYILCSIFNGTLSILDEFNGIESELLKFTVNLFKNNVFNDIQKHTSQLILSTHDITLMSINNMTLHNYFFIIKENNISKLYNASDLKSINNNLNIENLEMEYRNNKLGLNQYKFKIPNRIML